ncbi:MAG TPA: CCE_0567 family metalloprotein [Burkholderiaceae bacterium]|nr:CCE_0567 family metalloprotein [Burkholderiaceae bacterium]
MLNVDEQKATLKRLNARATQTKMDLHDLSEELPTNWQRIMEVAQAAFDAHAALAQARKEAGGA